MLDRLPSLPGAELGFAAYSADYDRAYTALTGVIWKLERHQAFREPGDPSWEAFMAGDWARAMELNEAERPAAAAQVAEERARGVEVRRLRVVTDPPSPYVQWEMSFLRLLAEAGDRPRVLGAAEVAPWEARHGELPEVLVLGDRLVYLLRYDGSGTPAGARRFDDPEVIASCAAEIAALYARGVPLLDYVQREIAPLPPPAPRDAPLD
jgi:hypothetical protein